MNQRVTLPSSHRPQIAGKNLQEDERLLTQYDMALTRLEAES